MGPWVHCQPLALNGSGFQRRILCPGICRPRSPCLSLFPPVCWPRWRRWPQCPRWPRWPQLRRSPQWPGPHREHPWHQWHPCHRPHRWWRDVWWQFHPLRCRRRHLFRVQFPHLQFMACLWLHGLYGMQAGIGETKNGFGKKLGSNEDRGTSSPFSLPETDQTTYKVSEFQNGYGYWCCSWMFSGFQRNNISLDVSGQVRKLHGCMTDSFHPMSRAPGTGMPLPCGHFVFFARCWDVG